MKNAVLNFIKKETILTIAGILALISCFLVPPDSGYAEYIDKNTILTLFCLMAVMAGLKSLGFFQVIGEFLLSRIHSVWGVVCVLVFLCFFGSMLITNDVALITFVPLAVLILDMAQLERHLCFIITFMTIAANLGSMLTPIGNPQNLYLYSVSRISWGEFIEIMLPYSITAAVLLLLCILIRFLRKQSGSDTRISGIRFQNQTGQKKRIAGSDRGRLTCYLLLFFLCVASVMDFVPVEIMTVVIIAALLILNRKLFLQIDYSLLATFIFFFIFIGNMKRFPAFSDLILQILAGHEQAVSIGISQVISNVPAALLLSGFTNDWRSLLIGTNLGGLGTLIASMASLISYKQIARQYPDQRKRYLFVFTVWNAVFLAVLAGIGWVLRT